MGFRTSKAECLLIGLGATTLWGRGWVGILFYRKIRSNTGRFYPWKVFFSETMAWRSWVVLLEHRGEAINVVPGTEGNCGALFARAFNLNSTTVLQYTRPVGVPQNVTVGRISRQGSTRLAGVGF